MQPNALLIRQNFIVVKSRCYSDPTLPCSVPRRPPVPIGHEPVPATQPLHQPPPPSCLSSCGHSSPPVPPSLGRAGLKGCLPSPPSPFSFPCTPRAPLHPPCFMLTAGCQRHADTIESEAAATADCPLAIITLRRRPPLIPCGPIVLQDLVSLVTGN
jgi:hypothetical protein